MRVLKCKEIHCEHLDREYNESCQQYNGPFICRAQGGMRVKDLESCGELNCEPQLDDEF